MTVDYKAIDIEPSSINSVISFNFVSVHSPEVGKKSEATEKNSAKKLKQSIVKTYTILLKFWDFVISLTPAIAILAIAL